MRLRLALAICTQPPNCTRIRHQAAPQGLLARIPPHAPCARADRTRNREASRGGLLARARCSPVAEIAHRRRGNHQPPIAPPIDPPAPPRTRPSVRHPRHPLRFRRLLLKFVPSVESTRVFLRSRRSFAFSGMVLDQNHPLPNPPNTPPPVLRIGPSPGLNPISW